MIFDPTKPVRLRNGLPARILATDLQGDYPIICAYIRPDGEECIMRVRANGEASDIFSLARDHDLVNIPESRAIYMAVYPGIAAFRPVEPTNMCSTLFSTLEEAQTSPYVIEFAIENDEVVEIKCHQKKVSR